MTIGSWLVRGGRAAAAALLSAFVFTGCPLTDRPVVAVRPPADDLAEKVARLERAVAEVQRGQTPEADLLRRVDRNGKDLAELRAELDKVVKQASDLQGRLESLDRASASTREANRTAAKDLDARLVDLDKKVDRLQEALAARPAEAPRPPAAPPPPERPQPPVPDKKPSPQALYDEAYALYRKQGKHEEARDRFKLFIQSYPDAPLVPNAHFWVGESYYDQAQYEPAILEYDNVIKKYPKSDKVPSALLKQAFAFDALDDAVGAKALLKKLIREFPKSDQAGIAQKKLDSLGE